ncbi:hypothetical protein ABKV19_018244 [Rosa sericea]
MEKLISSRSDFQVVPESFILPLETRPGNKQVFVLEDIPVIDFQQLGIDRPRLIKQIINAAQEFGFFQTWPMFFELPFKEKASFYCEETKKSCRLYTSNDDMSGKAHYWREKLRHLCHPLEEHMQFLPEKPSRYREVIGSYSVEARKLSLGLLELICEGLGLESGFFGDELTQVQVHGLQVFKDEQWLVVEPVPDSFVVNIGHTLQIISNGKLSSAEQRVVTNKKVSRMSVVSFIHPSGNCHIEPAKALLDKGCSTPLYREFIYKDFFSTYITDIQEGLPPLQHYKL